MRRPRSRPSRRRNPITSSIIHKLGRDAEGYLGVNPYAYWHDGAPGMAAMRAYNERVHPGEKYRPNS